MSEDTKVCPFCAEEIKLAAIVCKHCGRELPGYEEKFPTRKSELQMQQYKITPWQASHNFATIIGGISILVAVYNNYNTLTGEISNTIILDAITYFIANYFSFRVIGAIFVWLQRKTDTIQAILYFVLVILLMWLYFNNTQ